MRTAMASLRAVLIGLTLLFFFIFVTPLQLLAMRLKLPLADWLQMAFCRALLMFLRVRVHAVGSPSVEWPRLLVANHVSWADILVLASLEPMSFLAKHEVSAWPVISSFAKAQQTIFVDRSRRRSIPGANRAMAEAMRKGRSVTLFPEGTTLDGVTLGKFHTSHFAAARDLLRLDASLTKVDVQPAAISYSAPHAAWIGDDTLLPHLWLMLKNPPLDVHVAYEAPLAFGRDANRKHLAAQAKSSIETALAALRRAGLESFAAVDGDPAHMMTALLLERAEQ